MPTKNAAIFNKPIMQNQIKNLSLGTFCKPLAITGLIFFLFYAFLFDHLSSDHFTHLKIAWVAPSAITIISSSNYNLSYSPTNISHIVFGIAGTVNMRKYRRPYIEAWWEPNVTRGYLFLDKPPTKDLLPWPSSSPPFRINEDMARIKAYAKVKKSYQVRVFQTVLETIKAEDKDVRWYVMADDDTILFIDNLVEVLAKYDHTKYYYIGANSENILPNFYSSFGMAFGGAGYALSYPLAKALAANFNRCLETYQHLFASDFMLYSCLTDLGVNLTPEIGFHQIDLHGDISGLLSAHPPTLILSLHHIDMINPIFPSMNRYQSINHLMKAAKVDRSRLLQQTICYHKPNNWSLSVSWGYSTHIYESIYPQSVLMKPLETFLPWYGNAKPPRYMFNTRYLTGNSCEVPHVYFLDSVGNLKGDQVVTTYRRFSSRNLRPCSTSGNHSADAINRIQVFSPAKVQKVVKKIECCDVELAADMNVADIKIRPCTKDDMS